MFDEGFQGCVQGFKVDAVSMQSHTLLSSLPSTTIHQSATNEAMSNEMGMYNNTSAN